MGSFDDVKLLPAINTTNSCCFETRIPIEFETHKSHQLSSLVIIIIAILGGCFLLVSYYAIIVKYCTNFSNSTTTPQVQVEEDSETHEDFLDENHGPVLDHPIWYIRTVGLAQGVIDSIGVVKYKKGEGLVEGTDCSICLSEFEDDETLRLLPKCSHAFHVSCIDTWLRSHTNCPSCRAPVVATPIVSASTVVIPIEEETQGEDSESDVGLGTDQNGNGRVSEFILSVAEESEEEDKTRDVRMSKEDVLSPLEMSDFRVFSDLSTNHRVVRDGRQPVRRSASMDVNPASIFCFSVANSPPLEEEEGSSAPQLKTEKKVNLIPGIHKLMGSSSKGGLLPISSVAMKRSLSTGGKLMLSRSSQNRSSILPL